MLAVQPPLPPMLALLARDLPAGDGFFFEPKWDGFRCLAFRSKEGIDLRSRNQRPLSRYFPETVEALERVGTPEFALDGELVIVGSDAFDFGALLKRLHPSPARVARLRVENPAFYAAFDLLAVGEEALRSPPFGERRRRIEALICACPQGL